MIMGEVKIMLEAKIHKEITEYEGKIFFGMTGKQIVCVLIAFAIVIPLFFLLYEKIGVEITGYICIAVALPIMAIGFFKYKGTSFTDLVKLLFNFYIKNSKLTCINIVATDYFEKEVKTDGKRNRSRNDRKTNPRNEYTAYSYTVGTRKQLKEKRKEIREQLAAYKKKSVLQ